MSSDKVYIVTGANIGLGFDTARQLALMKSTKTVYMACRSEEKAKNAIKELVSKHRVPKGILKFIKFDGSSSKETIYALADSMPDKTVHGLILNAGGMGNDSSGKPVAPNNVVDMYQINLIGHIHLIDRLQERGLLNSASRIVFSSSEASRGVPNLGFPAPVMQNDKEFYKKAIRGELIKGFDNNSTYALTKGFGNLYFAAWAKRNPDITVLSISPGGTRGTNFVASKAMPLAARMMFKVMMPLMSCCGFFHSLDTGAKRYIDGVVGKDEYKYFPSGAFIASAKGTVGPVCNQIELESGRQYGDVEKQEMCYEVIRAVV